MSEGPDDVATSLRDFLNGAGGAWGWDDFISIPLADPRLEGIRLRAAAVDLPLDADGRAALARLLAEAERLAAQT